jgi:hypothetical protein
MMEVIENRQNYQIPLGANCIPLWAKEARLNQNANRQVGLIPTDSLRVRAKIGEGDEQIAYELLGNNTILKETKAHLAWNLRLKVIFSFGWGYERFLTWVEIMHIRKGDYQYIARLLPNNIVETDFAHGESLAFPGRQTNFATQEKVEGRMLSEFNEPELKQLFENESMRSQMLQIIWATKHCYVKFGATPDFYFENIIVTQDSLLAIDPGIYSFFGGIARSNFSPIAKRYIMEDLGIDLLAQLEAIEEMLAPSEQEVESLNREFDVNIREYKSCKQQAIEEIKSMSLIRTLRDTFMMHLSILVENCFPNKQLLLK